MNGVININQPGTVQNAQLQQPDILSRNLNNHMFKVTEQKVQLDIDLYKNTITGITDLWIVPNENVKIIQDLKFDCQNGINVLQVQLLANSEQDLTASDMGNREMFDLEFIHSNPINDHLSKNRDNASDMYNFKDEDIFFTGGNSIEQTDYLKKKKYEPKFDPFNESTKEVEDAKLYVNLLPFNNKLKLNSYYKTDDKHTGMTTGNTNPNTSILNNFMTPLFLNPSSSKPNFTPMSKNTLDNQDIDQLQPFTVRISYYIENSINEGIQFQKNLKNIPFSQCFTTNNLIQGSPSNWVPCIDNPLEKCLWEIEIMTLKNINAYIQEYPELADVESLHNIDKESEVMVLTGESTTQNVMNIMEDMPMDMSKRIMYTLLSPVGAAGVGFSLGFFYNAYTFDTTLGDFPLNVWKQDMNSATNVDDNDSEELKRNEELQELIYNSFMTLPKTLEFYSNTYGTYPFNSLNIVLVKDLYVDYLSFQGIIFLNENKFLYPTTKLDSMIDNTILLAQILSEQWFGLNITCSTMDDLWIIFGIQGHMTLKFVKDIMGNNEYQYRLKTYNDYLIENMQSKPCLLNFHRYMSYPFRLDMKDNKILEYIKIKSTLVITILDNKMTKMERSLGMLKVINKLNLLALSGDFNQGDNTLTNTFFQHQVEKTFKGKLNQFFKQWLEFDTVPIFEITQRFNKKKMVVEFMIKQLAWDSYREAEIDDFDKANKTDRNKYLQETIDNFESRKYKPSSQKIFKGNMTIRIHEADGIPYEHFIHISEEVTRLEIQYNSKYKKLKRGENIGLGNVLVTTSETDEWGFMPITAISINHQQGDDNEDVGVVESGTEAYEWIRIDSEIEWIHKIKNFNMKPEMYISQLQLDKDVYAQLQSLDYFEDLVVNQENLKNDNEMDMTINSCLLRCILDEKYFYAIRLRAIEVLSKYVYKKRFTGGCHHLKLVIKKIFFKDGKTNDLKLRSNEFVGYTNYQILISLIKMINKIQFTTDQDYDSDDPELVAFFHELKRISLKLLVANDNSKNFYDDTHYLCEIMRNLIQMVIRFPEDNEFRHSVWKIFTRYERLCKWTKNVNDGVYREILWSKLLLLNEGLNSDLFEIYDFVDEIYQITQQNDDYSRETVCLAFKILLIVGLKNKDIIKYFLIKMILVHNNDPYMRHHMMISFVEAVKFIILYEKECLFTSYNEDYESLQKIYNPNLFNDLTKFQSYDDFERFDESIPQRPVAAANPQINSLNIGAISNSEVTKNAVDLEIREQIEKQTRLKYDVKTPGSMLKYINSLFETFDPLKQLLWYIMNKRYLLTDFQKSQFLEVIPLMYKQKQRFYVTLKLPAERPLMIERGDVQFKDDSVTGESECTKYEMKVVLGKTSRYEKKKPIMRFALNTKLLAGNEAIKPIPLPKIKLPVPAPQSVKKKKKQPEPKIEYLTELFVKLKLPNGFKPKFVVKSKSRYYKTEIKRFGTLPLTSVKIKQFQKIMILSSFPQANDLVELRNVRDNSLIVKFKNFKKPPKDEEVETLSNN